MEIRQKGVKKVKGIIHWVNGKEAKDVEVRLYDRLFSVENPDGAEGNFLDYMNKDSLKVITAKVEPYIMTLNPGDQVQFERMGYFVADAKDSTPGSPKFNRTATLKDSWAKEQDKIV